MNAGREQIRWMDDRFPTSNVSSSRTGKWCASRSFALWRHRPSRFSLRTYNSCQLVQRRLQCRQPAGLGNSPRQLWLRDSRRQNRPTLRCRWCRMALSVLNIHSITTVSFPFLCVSHLQVIFGSGTDHLMSVLILLLFVSCCGDLFKKPIKSSSFQIGLGWNLAVYRLLCANPVCIPVGVARKRKTVIIVPETCTRLKAPALTEALLEQALLT